MASRFDPHCGNCMWIGVRERPVPHADTTQPSSYTTGSRPLISVTDSFDVIKVLVNQRKARSRFDLTTTVETATTEVKESSKINALLECPDAAGEHKAHLFIMAQAITHLLHRTLNLAESYKPQYRGSIRPYSLTGPERARRDLRRYGLCAPSHA